MEPHKTSIIIALLCFIVLLLIIGLIPPTIQPTKLGGSMICTPVQIADIEKMTSPTSQSVVAPLISGPPSIDAKPSQLAYNCTWFVR